MSELLSAYEVLNIAQTIEQNGATFYRDAARLHPETDDTRFLLQLAAMEDDHKKTFAAMQRSLGPVPQVDDDFLTQIDRYLKAVSDSANLEGSVFASYLFTGDESLSDIVMVGIDLEKETILYYVGLKDLFTKNEDISLIDTIIGEEKKHIATLAEEYQKLKRK
mgnify:CR=1 FL=1